MTIEISRTGSASTHRRILDSGRAVLAQSGYNDFSIRDVAARAGITPGAIYRHFRDREELIDRVVAESLATYELELTRAIASEPVGSFARVVAMGMKYIEFAREHPEEFKVLFSPLRGQPRKISELPGRGGFDILRQCVAEAIASGKLRDEDPDRVAFFLWSRVHGIVMLLLACDFSEEAIAGERVFTPELAFTMTRSLTLHGVGAPEKSRRKVGRSSSRPRRKRR